MLPAIPLVVALLLTSSAEQERVLTLELAPGEGPGDGRHIVFITGDEEYRSEEGMPQLARILAKHHGFRCSVLFSIDDETGEINPDVLDNIPGLEKLARADLMCIFTRFRDLPDEQMKHVVDYVESGRPIVGLRTATHAFRMKNHKTYERYSSFNRDWPGGFGKQILGETWVAHHGGHGWQATRGIVAPGQAEHPILRGIEDGDVWDPSDVYTVRLPMADGIVPILLGQVVGGMGFDDEPAGSEVDKKTGETRDKNDPMMPLAWCREMPLEEGGVRRVFTTTMGASQAFAHEGSRRLIVNACYWALGMDDQIDGKSNVGIVGTFEPTPFGFGKHRKGVRPADLVD